MDNKTSESNVVFRNRFSLGAAVSDLPPGTYRVTKEHELIEGISYPAFRTTSLLIEIPSIGTLSMTKQFIAVTERELGAALDLDARKSGFDRAETPFDLTSKADRAKAFDPAGPRS
jgi:hypothetical protein